MQRSQCVPVHHCSPPKFPPAEQTHAYLPFSFHTLYHFSSLTVFWRLGFRQCCCSPLTRVHRVTLQRKPAGVIGAPQQALPAAHPPGNAHIPQSIHPGRQRQGFPAEFYGRHLSCKKAGADLQLLSISACQPCPQR